MTEVGKRDGRLGQREEVSAMSGTAQEFCWQDGWSCGDRESIAFGVGQISISDCACPGWWQENGKQWSPGMSVKILKQDRIRKSKHPLVRGFCLFILRLKTTLL